MNILEVKCLEQFQAQYMKITKKIEGYWLIKKFMQLLKRLS
jgi:hypothetical protein